MSWKSLEVVLTVLIVSIVLRKAVRDPAGLRLSLLLLLMLVLLLLLWLVVIVGFWGIKEAGGVSILRHGTYVCEEGL